MRPELHDIIPPASVGKTLSITPFPASEKVYVTGSRADLRVPFRKVSLADTQLSAGVESNPPVYLYDTSGPYTDPTVRIDLKQGLPALRQGWIEDRGDTERLTGPSSLYGRQRQNDAALADMRFEHIRNPLRAKPGCNVSQMHYARRGIITPEMEYIAIRE
ncbi:MAG: phosphomethylpyrimidine synthase ThiC, partial [Methylococcaceae bacterium]